MEILKLTVKKGNVMENDIEDTYTLEFFPETIFPKVLDIAQELLKKIFDPEDTVKGDYEI